MTGVGQRLVLDIHMTDEGCMGWLGLGQMHEYY